MKLPQISGVELAKRLTKKGFMIIRQRGSHMRLQKIISNKIIKITIPNHNQIKKGTLHQIIKDSGLSPGEVFS